MPDEELLRQLRERLSADEPKQLGAVRTGEPDLGKLVRQSALPIIGGALGGAGGTMVAPGVGTVGGMMAGSAAGEAANQYFGITEPSGLNIGIAGATAGLPPLLRSLTTRLPGAAGGLQQAAVKTAKALPDALSPETESAALYGALKAKGANVLIPSQPLQRALDTFLANEEVIAKGFKDPLIRRATSAVESLIQENPQGIPFETFHANLKRLGGMIEQAEAKGGDVQRVIRGLYKGMYEALDAAAAGGEANIGFAAGRGMAPQAASGLREANQAFKSERARELVNDIIDKSINRKIGVQQINADRALTQLDRHTDELLRLVGPEEVEAIKASLVTLSKVPAITDIAKSGLGNQPFALRHVIGGAMGTAVGSVFGGGPGALGGATAGILVTEGISNALMSRPGRWAIEQLVTRGAGLDQIGNALAQLERSDLSQQQPVTTDFLKTLGRRR